MANSTKVNEKSLMAAIKAGNEDAFKTVYLHYYERLCIYILNFTPDRSIAEDVAQDTFLKLWNKRQTLRLDGSLNGYLYRLAYNKFIDICRKNKNLSNDLDAVRLESLSELLEEDEGVFDQKLKQVTLAIESLPPRCKEIFLLSKQSGLRYKDIAEQLGISAKTVEKQIAKALKTIRSKIDATLFTLFLLFRKAFLKNP